MLSPGFFSFLDYFREPLFPEDLDSGEGLFTLFRRTWLPSLIAGGGSGAFLVFKPCALLLRGSSRAALGELL